MYSYEEGDVRRVKKAPYFLCGCYVPKVSECPCEKCKKNGLFMRCIKDTAQPPAEECCGLCGMRKTCRMVPPCLHHQDIFSPDCSPKIITPPHQPLIVVSRPSVVTFDKKDGGKVSFNAQETFLAPKPPTESKHEDPTKRVRCIGCMSGDHGECPKVCECSCIQKSTPRPQEENGWEEEFDRNFINLGCAVQDDLKILIRKAIQAEREETKQAQNNLVDFIHQHSNDVERATAAENERVRGIIKDKSLP